MGFLSGTGKADLEGLLYARIVAVTWRNYLIAEA
jgi:hypothetical protein